MFKPYELDSATIKKMQNKMLETLIYFEKFCDEHNLMFYLCGGGAIGAIREHGFLKWDDDIDCYMPREDYERFPEIWEKYGDKERYEFCRTNEKINYHHAGSSLNDKTTTFICSYNANQEMAHGLMFEFMPIDGYPKNRLKRFDQLFNAFIFSLFNVQRLPDNKGKFIRAITWIVYKLVPSKKLRYKIWKHAEKRMSMYKWEDCDNVTELIGCIKGMLTKYPKEVFASQVWVDFEDIKVPLMAGYDFYLTNIFGDYMTPPPMDMRVAKHILDFVDMDHPYTDYRGIKYFPEKER